MRRSEQLWSVWREGDSGSLKYFCNRNAAIMWLKRYGGDFTKYRLNGVLVCVLNNYVWFYDRESGLKISAESKRTCQFATRNN